MLRWVRGVAVPLALGLVLVACGGDTAEESTDDGVEEDVEEAEPDGDDEAEQDAAADGAGFPDRPVTLVIGHGPGGLTDNSVRPIQAALQDALGTSVVIENVEGAGGMVAANQVFDAEPDGYTLFAVVNPAYVLQDVFGEQAPAFDEFEYLARLTIDGHGLTVAADSPFETLDDVIQAGEAGDLLAAGQPGASNLLLFEAVFSSRTGIDVIRVPYESGAEATRSVIDGATDISFGSLSSTRGPVDDGEARVLAHFAPEPMPGWEDVELFEDRYPGAGAFASVGLAAPPGTPQEILDILREAIMEAAQDARFVDVASEFLIVAPLEGEAWAAEVADLYDYAEEVRGIVEAALADE